MVARGQQGRLVHTFLLSHLPDGKHSSQEARDLPRVSRPISAELGLDPPLPGSPEAPRPPAIPSSLGPFLCTEGHPVGCAGYWGLTSRSHPTSSQVSVKERRKASERTVGPTPHFLFLGELAQGYGGAAGVGGKGGQGRAARGGCCTKQGSMTSPEGGKQKDVSSFSSTSFPWGSRLVQKVLTLHKSFSSSLHGGSGSASGVVPSW